MCVFTVVSLMKSSLPISAFESPRAIRRKTSCSRSLRSSSAFGGVGRGVRVNCLMTRFVTVGERSASPRGDDADCGEELLRRVVLEHEAARACAKRLVDVLVEVERRQDKDPRALVRRNDAPGRLEPVELRHPDVHQDHVRIEAVGLLHGLEPVARLGDDVDVLLAGEQHAKAGANHRLVVGDEHTDRHRSSPPRGSRVLSTKPPSADFPALISPP